MARYKAGPVRIVPRGDSSPDGRDLDAEDRARALVFEAGMALDLEGQFSAAGEAAVDLWQRGIAYLRASTTPPIELRVTEKLARAELLNKVRVKATVPRAGAARSGCGLPWDGCCRWPRFSCSSPSSPATSSIPAAACSVKPARFCAKPKKKIACSAWREIRNRE